MHSILKRAQRTYGLSANAAAWAERQPVRMAHVGTATTMIYVHHVPQVDAAKKLSAALKAASAVVFEPVSAAA